MKLGVGILLALGMFLLPFSTSAGEQSIVFSYGLPFLFLFALGSLARQLLRFFRVPEQLALLTVLAVLSTAWIVATSLIATAPLPSLGRAAVHVAGLFVFLHLLSLGTATPHATSVEFHRWSEVLLLSGVIMAAYFAIVFALAISDRDVLEVLSERWIGGGYSLPWGASNSIAAALLFPLIAGLALALENSPQWWRTAAIAMITFGILLSLSRNAIACTVLLFLGYSLVSKRATPAMISGVVLLAALLAAEWYEAGVLQEILGIRLGDSYELGTLNHRLQIWTDLLPLVADHLFWPIGFYGSLSTFDEISPHNAVLTTALEQGYVGLLLAFLLFAAIVRRLVVGLPDESAYGASARRTLLIGVLVVALNLQFEDPHFTYPYIIYAWFYLGLIALAARGIWDPELLPIERNSQHRYA